MVFGVFLLSNNTYVFNQKWTTQDALLADLPKLIELFVIENTWDIEVFWRSLRFKIEYRDDKWKCEYNGKIFCVMLQPDNAYLMVESKLEPIDSTQQLFSMIDKDKLPEVYYYDN